MNKRLGKQTNHSDTVLRLLISLCVILSSCSKSNSGTIEYIIPDNYSGYFWVDVDPSHGDPAIVKNGTLSLRIQHNGILTINDDSFFYGWHRVNAWTYSGGSIVVDEFGSASSTTTILRSLGVSTKNVHFYVVGPKHIVQPLIDGFYDGGELAVFEEYQKRKSHPMQ